MHALANNPYQYEPICFYKNKITIGSVLRTTAYIFLDVLMSLTKLDLVIQKCRSVISFAIKKRCNPSRYNTQNMQWVSMPFRVQTCSLNRFRSMTCLWTVHAFSVLPSNKVSLPYVQDLTISVLCPLDTSIP